MDLREFREYLLTAEYPDRLLRLADAYLTQMELLGSSFVLPKEHAVVKPVLEYYAGDLEGWLKFVRGVRDRLPPRSESRRNVQVFYRTLDVRAVQQDRRQRIDAAVDMAVRTKLIPDEYEAKVRYAKRCVQTWTKQRMLMLQDARRTTARGRVSIEERDTLLTDFWAAIDNAIENGDLPKP